ncbi:MAG: MoxR family ATPase [Thaumarchaeota archaeon]|nr:MoxR family ATPase [Nitrososphaerota archaeon]
MIKTIDSIKTIAEIKQIADEVVGEVSKYLVGVENNTHSLITALLVGGHVLLEGVPGTAKTSLATIFAESLGLSMRRIQATPDMMPADITGTRIYNPKSMEFEFRPGPIFANVVLMDEINRAPPKTQAALLECMQETQVTVDGITSRLQQPFMVIATKNPIETEGTFPLSAVQLDRFMFRLLLDYREKKEEVEMLRRKLGKKQKVQAVVKASALISAANVIRSDVKMSDEVLDYMVKVVRKTRGFPQVVLGASPTASVALLNAAKGYAALFGGRDYVTIEDVKAVAFDVLNHRIVLKQEAMYSPEEKDISGIQQLKSMLSSSIESIKV